MSEQRCGAIWQDTAPTQPGWYYLLRRRDGQVRVRYRDPLGDWRVSSVASDDKYMAGYYKFGPQVPYLGDVPTLNRLAAVARYALESWGMTLDEWESTHGTDADSTAGSANEEDQTV